MTNEGKERLLAELKKPDKYDLHALFQIRDALVTLQKYDLHDADLLAEVEKYLTQEEDEGREGYRPCHPDAERKL